MEPVALSAPKSPHLQPDWNELADVLERLSQGHLLLRTESATGAACCVLDGHVVRRSFEILLRDGLVAPAAGHGGFAGLQYYGITPMGHKVARGMRGRRVHAADGELLQPDAIA